MLFYIKGHKKNLCDRWFNTLKRYYRLYNIYTFPDMLAKFKTHDLINVHTLEEGDFRDWDHLLNLLYNLVKGISSAHIFYATDEDPQRLYTKHDDATETPYKAL